MPALPRAARLPDRIGAGRRRALQILDEDDFVAGFVVDKLVN
jgi:hypothetical protein